MNYTIFTREQVTPKRFDNGALNYGAPPFYPAGGGLYYAPDTLNIWSDDPAQRRVLCSDPNGTATIAEINAAFPLILEAKYRALWSAAAEWERKHISGVGLSILSLGVAAGKPKALAVAQWSANLWNGLYYPRKAAISLETQPDLDFTPAGEMPYSVPELSAEVWQ